MNTGCFFMVAEMRPGEYEGQQLTHVDLIHVLCCMIPEAVDIGFMCFIRVPCVINDVRSHASTLFVRTKISIS